MDIKMIRENAVCVLVPKVLFWFSTFIIASPLSHGAFQNDLTIGNAKALALGHAVTADPPGIDSIHYNPAGLTRLKGRQLHIKGMFGLFETNYEFGGYGEYQQGLIDEATAYQNENGTLNNYPDGAILPPGVTDLFYDEALNSKSEVEGATVMLPGGMVDVPFNGGPMGGASYTPPGSNLTFATNVYATMIGGINRADDDPGRYLGRRQAITHLTYFSPSMGIKVSDKFQVGFALNFSYSGFGLELPVREPHWMLWKYDHPWFLGQFCDEEGQLSSIDLNLCYKVSPYTEFGELKIEADQYLVFTFNVGLLWSPKPWVTLGVSYNSAIENDLHGEWSFPISTHFNQVLLDNMARTLWPIFQELTPRIGAPLAGVEETLAQEKGGKINVRYTLPQRLNLGLSVQVTPRVKYNFDVKWADWSVFSNIQMDFDRDVGLLMLGAIGDQLLNQSRNGIKPNAVRYQLGLRDTFNWGMGLEFQHSDRLAFRFGYEDRPSAVPPDEPNLFIPLNETQLYSAGFAYKTDEGNTLDFSVGYASSKFHYPPCSAKLGNSCNPNDVVYMPYQGQDARSELTMMLFEVMYSRQF